jgi:glyoxylase-like metal-dependent hydrolase (beta-lactamase superfamily II)
MCLAAALMAVAMVTFGASQKSVTAQAIARDDNELEIITVRDSEQHGRVHMIVGAGANILVQTTGKGIILVDAGTEDRAQDVQAALRTIARDKQVWAVFLTSGDPEKYGGVKVLAGSGSNIARGLNDPGAQVMAHEQVAVRLNKSSISTQFWPTDTYFVKRWTLPSLYYGDGIQIDHFPNAHTNGDSTYWFRRADVIAAGDLLRTDIYPVIDLENGGNVQGILDGLNWLLETAITLQRGVGGTLIIPSHGRLSDTQEVYYVRDMVTIIRDRVRHMIDRGMGLEAIKAAKPTLDYDGRYGATTGPWTTDMFVEAVYRSLSAK